MTAQGAQTNTAALTGWKDCWQRQQGREGRGTEEDISVCRYDVTADKIALQFNVPINFFLCGT
jgi:hypothetical protein